MKSIKLNIPRIILIFLLVILSLGALAGGTALIVSAIQVRELIPQISLINSPFHSMLIPGIILFIFIGMLPALTIYGLITERKNEWLELFNIYHDKHWSFSYSIYSSIILILWIDFEILFIGFNVLQFLYTLLGVAIMIAALYPKNFYRTKQTK